MTRNERANFGSKLGVILASAGSAVGLGNIWRFPFETGNHGGAAFILIYLVCVLILGIPIMIAEFLIGRRSRANTAGAYQKLAPGTHWRWVGRMGVLAGFLILGYYSVVAGWTLEFIGEAATNSFAGKSAAEFIASFNGFVSKWYIARAAVDIGGWLPLVGFAALLVSALLTAVYMFQVVLKAWFPRTEVPAIPEGSAHEAGWMMTVPTAILAAACLVMGLFPQWLLDVIGKAVGL